MANLTEVSYYTRRGVVLGMVGVVILFVLKFALSFGVSYWKAKNPPPPSKPTVSFGKLPKIPFGQNENYPPAFELQTIEGRTPEGSPSARVFFIPKKAATLFSRKKAEEFAKKLGFVPPAEILSPTLYQFTEEFTGNTLFLDITNNNFFFKLNYLDPSVLSKEGLPEKEEAVNQARQYFSSLGVWDESLKKPRVSYLKFEGQKLTPSSSLTEAQAVRVDFLKEDVGGLLFLPLEYERSSVYVVLSSSKEKAGRVLEARFYNFPPDLTTSATYPLITPKEAWENLKKGKAYIVRALQPEEGAVVRKIYLAYLEMPEYQPYLQPVYVFEGDRDFVAYVPAIDPLWLGE